MGRDFSEEHSSVGNTYSSGRTQEKIWEESTNTEVPAEYFVWGNRNSQKQEIEPPSQKL